MLRQEEQTIDGMRFTCQQFGAMRGFHLLARLVKSIGPAISVLQSVDPESDIKDIAPAIAVALKDLDADIVTALAVEILAGTSAILPGSSGGMRNIQLDNQSNIDMVFNGKLPTMFQALAFAVKVNYAEFFSGAGAQSGTLPQALSAQ